MLSNYFGDEKNIVEAYNQLVSLSQGSGRNLRKNKDTFLQKSSTVDQSLTHLIDGMLGTYNYGGDILRSTVDYVQVTITLFKIKVIKSISNSNSSAILGDFGSLPTF